MRSPCPVNDTTDLAGSLAIYNAVTPVSNRQLQTLFRKAAVGIFSALGDFYTSLDQGRSIRTSTGVYLVTLFDAGPK